jgi:UDP-glucose 4-epimerase
MVECMTELAGSVVAVTGGSGFVGGRLVRALAAARVARIVVLDRSPAPGEGPSPLVPVEHRTVTLGQTSAPALRAALGDARCLFHLAAEKHAEAHERPDDVLRVNVLGTHELLVAARDAGVRKVVFASSLYAYGRTSGEPLDEAETPEPRTVYGVSKLAGEHLGATFAARGGPAFVSLRYFFAYGPGQTPLHGRPSLIARTFERLSRGEPPAVRGDGSQALDYVYVDDVVRATIAAMESPLASATLNVGTGVALPVRELVERMQRIAGTRLVPVEEPSDETHATRRVASIEKARVLLGWTPEVTLDEGLRRTWDWMRTRGDRLRE